MKSLFAAAIILASAAALADEPNTQNLYDLSTSGTTAQLKAGEKGTFEFVITPKAGAHVSDDAPLKLELTGKNVKLEKTSLKRADAAKAEGQNAPAKFDVPFTGEKAGQGAVDVKATFFICTDKICARQQKTLSVPVTVQ